MFKEINNNIQIGKILYRILDVKALFKSSPGLFNLEKLRIDEKISLCIAAPKDFKDKFDFNKVSAEDKLTVLSTKNNIVTKDVILSAEEVQSLSLNDYISLLNIDFQQYINLEKFNKLTQTQQTDLFLLNPEWVLVNTKTLPKLTLERLRFLSGDNPQFIDNYIKDISTYSTDCQFWFNMMKYNKKYEKIFMESTKSLINATEVRIVVHRRPRLIKLLNVDILTNSKLTCKQWILLADRVMGHKIMDDWIFPDDIIDMFKLELTAEMLNGKSKMSNVFKRAMKNVFEKEIEQDEPIVIHEDEITTEADYDEEDV